MSFDKKLFLAALRACPETSEAWSEFVRERLGLPVEMTPAVRHIVMNRAWPKSPDPFGYIIRSAQDLAAAQPGITRKDATARLAIRGAPHGNTLVCARCGMEYAPHASYTSPTRCPLCLVQKGSRRIQ